MSVRLSASALLSTVWIVGLLTLARPRAASATLDCEEYPEYCPPPSCDNFTCLGTDFCNHLPRYNCDLHTPGQCTVSGC